MSDIDIQLAEEISQFYDDPLGFVRFAYPWGEPGTSLQGFDGPDDWQVDVLTAIGDAVKERGFDGINAVVARPRWIVVDYYTADGTLVEGDRLEELEAIVFLHEYDHLNGILMTDRQEDKK